MPGGVPTAKNEDKGTTISQVPQQPSQPILSPEQQRAEELEGALEKANNEMAATKDPNKFAELQKSATEKEKQLQSLQNKEKVVATIEQITTRGDGKMEKGELFKKTEINFGSAMEHLKIHHGGEVAGSQFNSKIFKESADVEKKIKEALPDELNYDQYGRAELTINIGGGERVGWSGVVDLKEFQKIAPNVRVEKRSRNPGGIEGEENGIKGAWYPEMTKDAESGRFVVAKDAAGNIQNLKGKFEPFANIATIVKEENPNFDNLMKTSKMTVIIQKDKQSGQPTVLTVFPGDNAPPVPAKINSETFKMDTLGEETQETKFWSNHAFIELKNQ